MPVMSAVESALCRSGPWQYTARRIVLPWVLDGRRLAGDVLEIGSGSGAMADGVARMFPDARLTVTDVDGAMVRSARHRLERYAGVTVLQADAAMLPFEAGSFDVVTSYLMLHHVMRWRDALTDAARVLRPGGLLIGYDATETRLASVFHRLEGSTIDLLSPDELQRGLVRAGFGEAVVDVHLFSLTMRFSGRTPAER